MLRENQIHEEINEIFKGHEVYWQQHNAPAHSPFREALSADLVILSWPAKSPNLNLIEQLWNYLKKRLAGRTSQKHCNKNGPPFPMM